MATAAQQQAFIATYGPYAAQSGNTLGISPNLILGQWAFESNWGTQGTAASQGNMAGIGGPGNWASYSTPQQFATAYTNLIQTGYGGALNAGSNANQFVNGLGTKYFGSGTNQTQYLQGVTGNANIINAQTNGGLLAGNAPDSGLGGSTIFEGGTGATNDPLVYNMDVTPNTATPQQTGTTGTASGYGTAAGGPGTALGYTPPASIGGPSYAGLSGGVVSDVGGWIGNVEKWFGGIWDNTFGAILTGTENLFIRGMLIFVGIAIAFVAIWRLAAPDVSAGDVVKAAAA